MSLGLGGSPAKLLGRLGFPRGSADPKDQAAEGVGSEERQSAMASTKLMLLFEEAPEAKELAVDLMAKLRAAGFDVAEPEGDSDGRVYLVVTAERELLEREAELSGMLKAKAGSGLASYFTVARGPKFEGYGEEKFFSEAEEALLLDSAVRGKIPYFPKFHAALEAMVPMRTGSGRALWRSTPALSLAPDGQAVVDYLGFGAGWYFEWLGSFTRWLIAPSILGAGLAAARMYRGVSIDEDAAVPLYSFFVVFWGVAFVRCWERRVEYLKTQWRLHMANPERYLALEDRVGHVPQRSSYPQRLQSYAVSAVVTLIGLGIAFGVMVCSLNLQGYIHDNTWTERPFYIPWLAQHAEEGAIFGPDANAIVALGPTVLHVAVIFTLNTLYREVAEVLTEWENHRTEEDHEYSLTFKRFFFEAFDCYIALFYLGFAQFDLPALRTELVSLYTTDQFRRVFLETIVPAGLNYLNAAQREKKKGIGKKDDDADATAAGLRRFAADITDVDMAEYEEFDDYLEMVIEFGYITLFASAFPLASLVSFLCNFVEMKSDLYKVCNVYRRPPARWHFGIGPWLDVLKALAALSVATNCFLFSFSSEQIVAFLPHLYTVAKTHVEDADAVLRAGSGRYVVAVCFGIEHAVGLICMLLYYLIPLESEEVQKEKRRLRQSKRSRERAEA
uniref:Anoctamin transmembrane domain-containing protein n=1 Tax=Phaeomonas parva TaxID=124430 RepID=A0A7S1U8V0_9STRA|mmetsp:Transcript_33736/g.106625  ORF Transcript_33736/g.106625 Transcript_33736/m.106625 type:complete len:673 (+) Transcript_33736:116-2134(+)